MAQIKYVVFACLLLLTGILAINFFQKISSTELIKEKPTVIDFETPSQTTESDDPTVIKGQMLFKQNCGSCHALDRPMSGPALRDVVTRGPWSESKENFKKWVRNPAAFIPTTQYTRDLQKQYGQIMPSFAQLNDDELESIYQYLTKAPRAVALPIASR